jgi:S1-C subfamily serine protease
VVLITILKPDVGSNPVYYNTVTAPPDAKALVTSGVMIDDGLVCTPAIRMEEGDRIIVTIDSEHKEPNNGGECTMGVNDYDATVIEIIPDLNLAFLRIQPRGNERFTHIELGNDVHIPDGEGSKNEWFITVGKAKGKYFVTPQKPGNRQYQFGIWASLLPGVEYVEENGKPLLEMKSHFLSGLLETNGGAIVGRDGKLVGIAGYRVDEYGLPDTSGIPVSIIKKAARAVVPNMDHTVGTTWLGANVSDNQHKLPKAIREILGTEFSDSPEANGCVITNIQVESAVHKAGVRPNDVVLRFNGKAVWNAATYKNYERYSFGDQMATLEVMRNGKLIDLPVPR